jgi:hypothetical protein
MVCEAFLGFRLRDGENRDERTDAQAGPCRSSQSDAGGEGTKQSLGAPVVAGANTVLVHKPAERDLDVAVLAVGNG